MEITLTAGDRLPIPGGCIVTIENDIILIKEKSTKFKKGDFIARTDSEGGTLIAIYDKVVQIMRVSSLAMYTDWDRRLYFNNICDAVWAERFASEEEKQILIEKLHEAGKDWDAEKCEVVDFVWMPGFGEEFFTPKYSIGVFRPICDENRSYFIDNELIAGNVAFKTFELCQDFCDQANGLLKNAKKF